MDKKIVNKQCKDLYLDYKNVCKIIDAPAKLKSTAVLVKMSSLARLGYQQDLIAVKNKFELCYQMRINFTASRCPKYIDYGHINVLSDILEEMKKIMDEIIKIEELKPQNQRSLLQFLTKEREYIDTKIVVITEKMIELVNDNKAEFDYVQGIFQKLKKSHKGVKKQSN